MPVSALEAAALKCLQSGDYSDLTIKCNGKEFQVHKFVLCTQSAFFAKAVKKGAFEEGQTGVISMNHDDPDAIDMMIKYLYTGDYSPESQTMQSHLKVYELAEKVAISALKTLSEDKFKGVAKDGWKDASFARCVRSAYNVSPPGETGAKIRSIVVAISAELTKELFKMSTDFRDMMLAVAEFGADLAEVLCDSHTKVTKAKAKGSSGNKGQIFETHVTCALCGGDVMSSNAFCGGCGGY